MHRWTPFAATLISMKTVGITNKQWQRVATWQPIAIAWRREETQPAGLSLPPMPATIPYNAHVWCSVETDACSVVHLSSSVGYNPVRDRRRDLYCNGSLPLLSRECSMV